MAGLDNIIDTTPNLIFTVSTDVYCRGMEIDAYLLKHAEVDKYLILDDINDFFEKQQQYYLYIYYKVGFTDDDLQYCLKYFE